MFDYTRPDKAVFLGLDVHKKTIVLAALPAAGGDFLVERTFGTANLTPLHKCLKALSKKGTLFCCYEASGAGFRLQRLLSEWGFACQVVAPSKIPKRPGERRKTDRLDARRLAEYYRSGLLTVIHIPTAEDEAARDFVRCRAAARKDVRRSQHRVTAFLRRKGWAYTQGKQWTKAFWEWLHQIRLPLPWDQESLDHYVSQVEYLTRRLEELDQRIAELAQTDRYREPVRFLLGFRGIATYTAMVLVTELGDVRRFESPRRLMAFLGLVPSEHSSGEQRKQGAITKTGNTYARHVMNQASWAYRHQPALTVTIRKRQENLPAWLVDISWRAQKRLSKRYRRLASTRNSQIAITAVARELTGFLWAAMRRLADESLNQAS